jgi:hypothetical protein
LTQARRLGVGQTCPALAAMYRFIPWFAPTVEKFSRS